MQNEMKFKTNRISINVLNYNTFEKTKRCIISCLSQENIDSRVLLIDNCSTDGSAEKLREEFGDRIDYLFTDSNYGYAKGNNLGVEDSLAKGYRYSMILNSDTELVGTDLLSKMVNLFSEENTIGIVAPQIYNVSASGLILNQNEC